MKTRSPVILIPGFTGTNLANVNGIKFNTIYSAVKTQFNFDLMDSLRLRHDGFHDEVPEVIIQRADLEDLAYREIAAILKRDGYPVYIFGYDWRKSARVSGLQLKEFVNAIKVKLEVDNFNFLTHSMGGIVFECFLNELRGDYSSINRAVITACPFRGHRSPPGRTAGSSPRRRAQHAGDIEKVPRCLVSLKKIPNGKISSACSFSRIFFSICGGDAVIKKIGNCFCSPFFSCQKFLREFTSVEVPGTLLRRPQACTRKNTSATRATSSFNFWATATAT